MTEHPDLLILPLPGSAERITLRRIPAGEFRMGARGEFPDEEPIHRVRIPDDFFLGEFPVTQAQFAAWTETAEYRDWFERHREIIRETSVGGVAEPHANHFPDRPRHPAENVTWWEAQGFAEWLNDADVLPDGWIADLPTEAQWEYACRGGTESAYWSGDRETDLAKVGWYGSNAGGETHEVGAKGDGTSHRWGLSDLHGNVSEWCLDYFDSRHHRRMLDGEDGAPILEKGQVEPGEANPNYVACAAMMSRFAEGDGEARDEDRVPLAWLVGLAERVLQNGDASWQPVFDASSVARSTSFWPESARDVARELRDIFRQWVKNATSVESPARVMRGGAWDDAAAGCRSAYRFRYAPGYRFGDSGFRLAVVPGSGGTKSGRTGAERREGGGARQDAAAEPQSGRGAAGDPPRSGGDDFSDTMTTTKESDQAPPDRIPPDRVAPDRALSSANGTSWWGVEVPFPFPDQPDPTVRKIVLGNLEDGKPLTLDETTLAGLAEIGKHFPRLTHLHLWGLSNLARVGGLPEGLECLDVRKCPALISIGPVPATLTTLDLGHCPALTELPEGPLDALEYVWLDGCEKLEQFTPLCPSLPGLKRLELHGCQFRDLDPALCGEAEENVAGAVRAYFDALVAQGVEALAECKIVVLGNGGVGKTELVRSLKGLPYHPEQDSTDGIRLWHWHGGTEDGVVAPFAPFPEDGIDRVDLNVWDFGGQDLYHNTHRLFLENRAVFVVVWREPKRDAGGKIIPFRKEHPEDPVRPLNYWLDQVYAFNPRARVVVVRTGADEGEPSIDWRDEVREEYRGLDHFAVSSAVRTKGDLPGLRQWILEKVRKELGGAEAVKMPRGRVAVRRALAQWQPAWDEGGSVSPDSARPLLRRHEYVDLVRDRFRDLGLDEPAPFEIVYQLDYFHHSGALYAPKKWLEEVPSPAASPIIVDQRWAIEGIYRMHVVRDLRDRLIQSRGHLSEDDFREIWVDSRAGKAGGYDENAQWTMRRFMKHCGLLIESGDDIILPEFLPDRKGIERFQPIHSYVAGFSSADRAKVFRIRHRSLGQGFGCLLVGRFAERFQNAPLFRYGGYGRIDVGNDFTGGGKSLLVKLEWARRHEDDYQGDIVATILADDGGVDEALALLGELVSSMPGFPRDAQFENDDGSPIIGTQAFPQVGEEHLPSRQFQMAVPRPGLGTIGLSIAGNDYENPEIEFWPDAIRRALLAECRGDFEVIYYKSDRERKTMPSLFDELVTADLFISVIGKKYLHSPYCMAEFFRAARHHQPEATFEDPSACMERIFPVLLPDAGSFLLAGEPREKDADSPNSILKAKWVERGANYLARTAKVFHGLRRARDEAPKRFVFDSWMRFAAEDEDGIASVLSAMANCRKTYRIVTSTPDIAVKDREAAADEQVKPFVSQLVEALRGIVGSLDYSTRLSRTAAVCLQKWNRNLHDVAADTFETFLAAWPDPARVREEALQGVLPEEWKDLEPVRAFWVARLGVEP